jgi:hypothetical protein
MATTQLTEAEVRTKLKEHFITLGMTEADAEKQAGLTSNRMDWLDVDLTT